MKKLIKVNGKDVMYVQVHNLIKIREKGLELPFSKKRINFILNNLETFKLDSIITFEDPREIKLLKSYDFILTENEVKKYNEEDLILTINKLKRIINGVNKRLEDPKEKEKYKNDRFFKLRYKMLFVNLERYQEILKELRINKDLLNTKEHTNKR